MFINLAKTSREAQVPSAVLSQCPVCAVAMVSVLLLDLQVVSVSKKEKVKQRPQALNTVEMLRVASQALGEHPTFK